jgi:hypothetical protein
MSSFHGEMLPFKKNHAYGGRFGSRIYFSTKQDRLYAVAAHRPAGAADFFGSRPPRPGSLKYSFPPQRVQGWRLHAAPAPVPPRGYGTGVVPAMGNAKEHNIF